MHSPSPAPANTKARAKGGNRPVAARHAGRGTDPEVREQKPQKPVQREHRGHVRERPAVADGSPPPFGADRGRRIGERIVCGARPSEVGEGQNGGRKREQDVQDDPQVAARAKERNAHDRRQPERDHHRRFGLVFLPGADPSSPRRRHDGDGHAAQRLADGGERREPFAEEMAHPHERRTDGCAQAGRHARRSAPESGEAAQQQRRGDARNRERPFEASPYPGRAPKRLARYSKGGEEQGVVAPRDEEGEAEELGLLSSRLEAGTGRRQAPVLFPAAKHVLPIRHFDPATSLSGRRIPHRTRRAGKPAGAFAAARKNTHIVGRCDQARCRGA